MAMLPADILTGLITEQFTDSFFSFTRVTLGSTEYEVVGDDEIPSLADDDLVLRAPDGSMFLVEVEVMVSDYDPPDGAA
jgi:hypothetical protein